MGCVAHTSSHGPGVVLTVWAFCDLGGFRLDCGVKNFCAHLLSPPPFPLWEEKIINVLVIFCNIPGIVLCDVS